MVALVHDLQELVLKFGLPSIGILTSSSRGNVSAARPFLSWISRLMARNQVVGGRRVAWKRVPAVSEV